jgi:hypothetical protein
MFAYQHLLVDSMVVVGVEVVTAMNRVSVSHQHSTA